jgi:hypothetical protein
VSAWLWYKEVIKTLSSASFVLTDAYKGVVYKLAPDGEDLFASIHVGVHPIIVSKTSFSPYLMPSILVWRFKEGLNIDTRHTMAE